MLPIFMAKRLTIEEFLERAHEVHGDKYDYSKTDLNNRDEKGRVCVICHEKDIYGNEHGEFWVTPSNHLKGRGCGKCKGYGKTMEYLIPLFRKVHGDKYDYSQCVYKGMQKYIYPICPKHGAFPVTPQHHLENCGCPYCRGWYKTTESFIKELRERFGDGYDYSKVEYVDAKTKVLIGCPIHGYVPMTPDDLLHAKCPCSKCAGKYMDTEEFIRRARLVHGNKYDYSKVDYKKAKIEVCIICHEKDKDGNEHGEFWQTPDKHLRGHGCLKCDESRLEETVRIELEKNNINYIYEDKPDWLKSTKKGRQSLDFYLPDYKIAIECQGEQHYKPIEHFGGEEGLIDRIERDNRKKLLCEENNISLLYFTDKSSHKYQPEAYVNVGKLINDILKSVK